MAYTESELEEMAVLAIFYYYDERYTKEFIENNFKLAIKAITQNIIFSSENGKVAQLSEGGIRSVTFKQNSDSLFTPDVLALLPRKRNFNVW